MNNLSQEEIEAMMAGNASPEDPASQDLAAKEGPSEGEIIVVDKSGDCLTPEEKDLLGEVGNMCMGASATTMYTLLNRQVTITTPRVQVYSAQEVLSFYHTPFVVVEVEYVEGVSGKNLLLLKEYDAALITDLLMGGDGKVTLPVQLDELHLSAMSEIMNQMIGSSATSLSNLTGKRVDISTPHAQWMDVDADISSLLDGTDLVIKIAFDMEIEGLLKSELMQVMSLTMGKKMSEQIMSVYKLEEEHKVAEEKPAPAPAAAPAPAPAPPPPPPPVAAPTPAQTVNVSPVQYPAFAENAYAATPTGNMELIRDVPLQVGVELGSTRKNISEVLEFGVGSIVVLEKMAGEPVEVLVNGKLIARGEVVVIDENYGVRITEIVNFK